MNYRIEWSRSAVRELRAIDQSIAIKILEIVGRLKDDPRPKGVKKLKGFKDLWRLRVGQYRVIYFLGDAVRLVRVERVGHRRDIYK